MEHESSREDAEGSRSQQAILPAASRHLTVELAPWHNVRAFSCSRDPQAASYLQNDVGRYLREGCGQAYVRESSREDGSIDGYYHLVGSNLRRGDTDNTDQKRLPSGAPIPVYVIAYIARDDKAAPGVGAALLVDAARRAQALFPTWGMTLYAKNAGLVKFYQDFGFKLIRSLHQEKATTGNLPSEGPYLMYAPYRSLVL